MKALLYISLGVSACTTSPGTSTSGAGGATASATTADSRASSSAGGVGGESTCNASPESPPVTVPAGWLPWTCWPGCTFWVPPDASSMPSPIQWEPCAIASGNPSCQEMTTPWDQDAQGGALALSPVFAVGPQGQGRLLIQRLAINGLGDTHSYVDWVEGDVDGQLDFAMRQHRPGPATCSALVRDFAGDKFALSLHGDGVGSATNSNIDGLLIGQVGQLAPQMVYRDDKPGTSDWSIGSDWVTRNDYGLISAHALDYSTTVTVYSPKEDPDHLPFDGGAKIIGHSVLFQVGNYSMAGLRAYDEIRGSHALVRYAGDPTQGAINVGTDGKDIVWSHGEGKGPSDTLYAKMSVITAPFTTDPAVLSPRRLRTDLSLGIGTKELQFAVGCGYAGRQLVGSDAEIVRLSDGAGWRLAGSASWSWNQVLGFTCQEVFVAAHDALSHFRVARISLASLGPPLPPD